MTDYREERDIIIEALETWEALSEVSESLIYWLDTDEVVNWFVAGYCCNDYDEVLNILENQEDYDQVIDYYERHCL